MRAPRDATGRADVRIRVNVLNLRVRVRVHEGFGDFLMQSEIVFPLLLHVY